MGHGRSRTLQHHCATRDPRLRDPERDKEGAALLDAESPAPDHRAAVNPRKEANHGHEEDRGAGGDADDRQGGAHLDGSEKALSSLGIWPRGLQEGLEALAEHPTLGRLVAAAEAGLGLWLALRVYSQEE
jgi:hypothetical protein